MAMDLFKNFAYGGILIPPAPPNLGTSLTVYGGVSGRFPAPPFSVSVWPIGLPADPTNAEILRVTAVAGDVWTIVRRQEGTAARAIEVNDQVAQALTVKALADLQADLKAYCDAKDAATRAWVPTQIPPTPPPITFLLPRVTSIFSGPYFQPNCDTTDIFSLNGLAETVGIDTPIGTPHDGQALIVRVLDNGTPHIIGWGTGYMNGNAYTVLPGTTAASKQLHVALRYHAAWAKWVCLSVTQAP